MAKLRAALLIGPKTIEELMSLGISRAMAYRDLGVLLKSGEVRRVENVDKGTVRVTYVLTSGTLTVDDELVHGALEKSKSQNHRVKDQALADLKFLARKTRIIDSKSLGQLISLAKSDPSADMLEMIAAQAVHAQKVQDTSTLEQLRTFTPTATLIVKDAPQLPDTREQALRFLQLTADFDTLSELAIKIASTPGDPALNPSNQTQFGIVLQSICANAARFPKYRNQVYDLLLSNDSEISMRAQEILNRSREQMDSA